MSELFEIADRQSPVAQAEPFKVGNPYLTTQRIRFTCDICNRTGTVVVEHYDKFSCACGKVYWALRPKRYGPLVACPWPGTVEMLAFRQAALTADERR